MCWNTISPPSSFYKIKAPLPLFTGHFMIAILCTVPVFFPLAFLSLSIGAASSIQAVNHRIQAYSHSPFDHEEQLKTQASH